MILKILIINKEDNTFSNLAFEIPADTLIEAYDTLNESIEKAENYVHEWKHYQELWELDIKKVYEFLGKNQNNWEQILNEIKKGKTMFNYATVSVNFGPIKIHYRVARRKINNKYDALHTEILNEFGNNMLNSLDFKKKVLLIIYLTKII